MVLVEKMELVVVVWLSDGRERVLRKGFVVSLRLVVVVVDGSVVD